MAKKIGKIKDSKAILDKSVVVEQRFLAAVPPTLEQFAQRVGLQDGSADRRDKPDTWKIPAFRARG